MDEARLNSMAWDKEARSNNFWSIPASEDEINYARNGNIKVRLTPTAFVPISWISNTRGKRMLLLASSGGQQSVLFSAFGSSVFSIDISPEMVKRDNDTLKKYGLEGKAVVGDMRDLSLIESDSIDYVFIPHSLNFISSLDRLYSEVKRVLKRGGHFLFGTANPALYIFDERKMEKGKIKAKYTIPFSDEKSKSEKELRRMMKKGDTFEYSHSLKSIIEPLFSLGFVMTGFYSDEAGNEVADSYLFDSFLAFNFLNADSLNIPVF